jgi:glycosidase
MRDILYNPFSPNHKIPVGSVKNSDNVLITINIVKEYNIYQMHLVIRNDENQETHRLEMQKKEADRDYNAYSVSFKIEHTGLFWYFFEFNDSYGSHFIGANRDLDGVLTDFYPISWQMLVHQEFLGKLDWLKGKIMYQIMVDRFHSSGAVTQKPGTVLHSDWHDVPNYESQKGVVLNNDFFGGNLRGIIEKLDYLRELNVGVIYLNPIFESPSNHKYDTSDYSKIDSMFGTEDDFRVLCEQAAQKGISVIFDGVFNHTGDDSRYFNKYGHYPELGAYQSRSSKYFTWYNFIKFPDKYACWWGFKTLPTVNQNDPNYIKFITGKFGIIDKWLTLGAKGVRLDVVDELNDNFLDQIYARAKANHPDNLVLGEVWEDASTKMAYEHRRKYLLGTQMDSVMNYPLKNAVIDFLNHDNLTGLVIQIRHLINNYPKHVLDCLMNHLGTHDTVRLLSNFANANPDNLSKEQQSQYKMSETEFQNAVMKLKMASAIQFTLPGVPSIFYGDEAGIEGFRDPFCRKPFPWDNINPEILEWYKKLGKIRQNEVFVDGVYLEESTGNNVFAFSRQKGAERIMTIVNNNNNDVNYSVNYGYDLIDENPVVGKVFVPKKSAKILQIK